MVFVVELWIAFIHIKCCFLRTLTNTRLTCPLWFGLIMSNCQRVTLWGSQWTDESVRLYICNHVGWLVVCRCGAQRRWRRRMWRSCGFVPMDRERWRTDTVTWLRDWCRWVTNRGGCHLGYVLAWGRDRAGRVPAWSRTDRTCVHVGPKRRPEGGGVNGSPIKFLDASRTEYHPKQATEITNYKIRK
jgi:hypothetical protein